MFRRKQKTRNESADQGSVLPDTAQETLDEILEYGCELIPPPAALVAQFHRHRIGEALEEREAIAAELEALADEAQELAGYLKPVSEQENFGTALREALTQRR